MSDQFFKNTGSKPGDDGADTPIPATAQVNTHHADDILAEIDGVLEENAAAFVSGFVQKGGQ